MDTIYNESKPGIENFKKEQQKKFIEQIDDYINNYSDEVPVNRITIPPDAKVQPKLKATNSYFRGVEQLLRNIAEAEVVEDPQQLKSYADSIAKMIEDSDILAHQKSEEDMIHELVKLPEHLQEKLAKKIDQGLHTSDAFFELMKESDLNEKEALLKYVNQYRQDSRIPAEGEVPEDIRQLRERQILAINDYLDDTKNMLAGTFTQPHSKLEF